MGDKKRVVHMTTVHHPYDPRIYHKECMSLVNAGYDVTLIAQQAENPINHKQLNFVPIKNYSNRFNRMIFGTIDAYKKAKKIKADIYHFHDPELLPIGWLLKKKNKVVIYDIHEDYITSILQKEYMNKPLKKIIAVAYKFFEKLLTRKLELCLAEKYYKDIYKRGKCILNYPTVNEKFLKSNKNNRPLENKVLYTGNVSIVRGSRIHSTIPLIDENISVYFVGKCPKALAEEMYDIAGEKKDQLVIEGIDQFIQKDIIEDRYVRHNWLAGIALFPPTDHYKKKELTKFFEYMNAGLPIICSDFPVWKHFIEKYKCGISVNPYNENEIKQAIQFLKDNQEEAKQMGENGKKAVVTELNWLSEEKKLISWYDELLKQKQFAINQP